jgi:cytochrome c oxidase subunit 3
MSPENSLLTPGERSALEQPARVHPRLEEQYENLEQQHEVASLGMWIFLATEVLLFGSLFTGLGAYLVQYPAAFEKASEHLNWLIGGINTLVLLTSSLTMVLAVHYAKLGQRRPLVLFLSCTALLGICFLALKGLEYHLDYWDKLIPGWSFDPHEWLEQGVNPQQVQLFLLFYWIMTGFHALHMTIGIAVVILMSVLAWRGYFSAVYYAPVDVSALYWHFVDIVWLFLLPMLYLIGTHTHF